MVRKLTGEMLDAAKALTTAKGGYLTAKGTYDQACDESNALWAEVPDDWDDAVFNTAFNRIESLVPVQVYSDALRVSEDVLIAAGRRFLILDPRTSRRFGKGATDLDRLFNNYRRNPTVAERLIASTMGLDPYA